jgi:hypothetical protein
MAQRTFGPATGFTFTNLGTIGSGAMAQSAALPLAGHYDYLIRLTAARGTGAVTNDVDIYVAPVKTDGTYVDGASGTSGTYSGTLRNAVYIGSLKVRTSLTDSVELSLLATLKYIPAGCALIAVNNTGGTMNGGVVAEVVPVSLGPQ